MQQREGGIVRIGPAELLEIHRIHHEHLLLAWNHNALHVFPERQEGPRLNVVVAAICHEKFDCSPRLWTQLDFIENDDGPPFMKIDAKDQLKSQHDVIDVGQIVEQIDYVRTLLRKVDQDVAEILPFRELLNYGRLAYSPRALDQQGTGPL